MTNDKILPETPMRVLMRADEIPDKSVVAKRTGEQSYTLSRDLVIYTTKSEDSKPMTISGFFLVGDRGSINQVPGDHLLHWCTTAKELVDDLQRSWATSQ